MDVSPNEEHILIGINLPYEKEASERFRVRVYDKQMSLEWEREISMPYTDKEFAVRGMLLENDGDVVALGVKYLEKQEPKEKKRDGKATYDHHLLTFNSEGEYTDNMIMFAKLCITRFSQESFQNLQLITSSCAGDNRKVLSNT